MKFSLKHSIRWSLFISIVTFVLACIFSVASTILVGNLVWSLGMILVFVIVFIGILFDTIGIAAAAATELTYHGKASEKVHGAKHAIQIVRNADKFSNFCNDVIGDICGIISGTASALVIIKLFSVMSAETAVISTVVNVFFAGLVSAVTVGGKAIGKSYGIHHANEIVFIIGKLLYFLETRFGIKLLNGKKNKSNGKRGNKSASRPN